MTEKELNRLIESINGLLKEEKKLFLYYSHGGYNVKMRYKSGYKDLTPFGTPREIYFFLSGMFQTLDLKRKRKI